MGFERIGSEEVWQGQIGGVRVDTFRYDDGEDPERTARRELAEEIGKGAGSWRHLVSFYNSPGILAEENHLFLAEDLYDERRDSEENERIEIVELEVEHLDETIGQVRDAKTLIGLLWFRAFLPS